MEKTLPQIQSSSDPEDDSSGEQTRRDDERGHTVLAKVGKAIQDGNKITLECHPVYKVPCGDNRTTLFFAPYHENCHWMLAVISLWNGTIFWLDPAGADTDIREFAQTIINDGIKSFSLKYRTDIKKLKKNPKIKWNKSECPRQSQDSKDCGYYICRYMLETIEKRRQGIPEQYFGGAPTAYSQMKIDELRDMWIRFVHEYKVADHDE